jgi:hypothetical protein
MKSILFFFVLFLLPITISAQCVAPTGATSTVTNTTVTFNWSAGNYNYYRVQYRRASTTNAKWNLIVVTNNQTSTSITLPSGNYVWGVRGFCVDGYWSPLSPSATFTIPY